MDLFGKRRPVDVRANVRTLLIPAARAMAGKLLVRLPDEEFHRIVELAVDAFIVGPRRRAFMVLEREFGLHHFVWIDPFDALAELDRIREAA